MVNFRAARDSYTFMGFELFQEIHLPRIQWVLEQPEWPFIAAFAF